MGTGNGKCYLRSFNVCAITIVEWFMCSNAEYEKVHLCVQNHEAFDQHTFIFGLFKDVNQMTL